MTIILPTLSELIRMRQTMFLTDRTKRSPSRRALAVAGAATLVFSLVVSIAPALAAPGGNGGNGGNGNGGNGGSGGGNAGTVKIHDAATGVEAGETGNEPWTCTFWIGFYNSDVAETGDWQVVSWPPTGDGTVVASGSYDTTGDGVDTTAVFSLADGHYRLEWQSTSDKTSKHKTFWVGCEVEDPIEDPVDASPSPDPEPSDEESPSLEASPSEDASPSEEASPSQEESTPSDEGSPSDNEEPATDDPDQSPEGQVKDGNSEQHNGSGNNGGHQAPAEDGVTALPDTSTTPAQSGVLATIGVLLILVAHAGTRRERNLPSA